MSEKRTENGVEDRGRDEKGRFVKGNKGGGRPATPEEFKKIAKEKSVEALERLVDIAEDPNGRPEHIIRACELIIAYGVGKPLQVQNIDLNASLVNFIGEVEEKAEERFD